MLIDRPNIVEGSSIQNATIASGATLPSLPGVSSVGELFFDTSINQLRTYTGLIWDAVPTGVQFAAHLADQTLHLTITQNTLLDGLNPALTSTELNFMHGVTSPVQTQFNTQGGTLTSLQSQITLNQGNGNTALGTHEADFTLHLTSAQNTWIDAITASSAEVNYSVGVTSGIQSQINTINGIDVTQNNTLTSLQSQITLNQGNGNTALGTHEADFTLHLTSAQNTFLDGLNLPTLLASDINNVPAHVIDYTKHLTSAQNTWIDAITASSTEVNYSVGVTSSVQTQLNVISTKLPLAGGTMTGSITMSSGTITGVPTPVNATDVTNKAYVDNLINGLNWKNSVRAATTVPISLTGLQTVDGVSLNATDRVLVKNQGTSSANGVHVDPAGTWTRSADAVSATELTGLAVFVNAGGQANEAWTQVNTITTIGVDPVVFSQFAAAAGALAGAGITITAATISVNSGDGLIFNGQKLALNVGSTLSLPSGQALNLASVSNSGSGSFVKLNIDTYGRVVGTTPVTTADIGALASSSYVLKAGDTMTGALTGTSFIGPLTGNASTATNVAYSGLTGTVPTWNQSTAGNAATATNVAYSGLTGTVPTWNQNTTGTAATVTTAAQPTITSVGTLTSLNIAAPAYVTALSGITTGVGAIAIGTTAVPAGSASFTPYLHGVTTLQATGYNQHLVIGDYRTGSAWGGGCFIGFGGSDSYPTENFLFGFGGSITHSNGNTFLSSSNYNNYSPTLTGGNASGSWSINITGTAGSCSGNAATVSTLSAAQIFSAINNQANSDWYRTSGATGWYSTSYAVGIYATEAGNVRTYNGANFIAGGTVSGTNLSGTNTGDQYNISGNAGTATLASKASTLSQGGANGAAMTFSWSGQGGQPTWLWGGNDGVNTYLYNPSNFSVNYAASAGSATSAGTAGNTTSISGAMGNTYSWTTAQQFVTTQSVGYNGPMGSLWAYSISGSGASAGMAFHRGGAYAINMGLDTDNIFRLGGWSDGSNVYRFQSDTAGNFNARGSITGANLSGTNTGDQTNISGNAATAGSATYLATSGGNQYFNWSGQSGQPTWLWGANAVGNAYLYNPSNFSVAYAATAGSAPANGGTSAACSGNAASASSAGTVTHNAGRTDGAAYPIVWMSGSPSPAYSCAAVTITSSTGLINCSALVASGDVTAFSDIRVKTDIMVIANALDKVNQLRGVTYTRTDEAHAGERQTGVIAQEVQAVLPEAVKEDPTSGMLSVAYGNMVGLMIEAIKELSAKVAVLEMKLSRYEE